MIMIMYGCLVSLRVPRCHRVSAHLETRLATYKLRALMLMSAQQQYNPPRLYKEKKIGCAYSNLRGLLDLLDASVARAWYEYPCNRLEATVSC